MGLIFFDHFLKLFGKELAIYLKLPYIGAMNDQNIFIIDTVCDLLMSASFVFL